MLDFQTFTLDNGLEVYLHRDTATSIVALNLLYKVGSKHENDSKTGFAHLFEHLMFSGSKHIPSYDEALQRVGGENNAFTTPDFTNYYVTLPANNLETALWLESDRMLSLNFKEEALETQRKVVIEEFKQRYLNQPYGKVKLLLQPLAYKVHPYRWATIGKDISHIEQATMEDVKDFFYKFYRPNNAILSLAGNMDLDHTKALVEKWFGDVPKGKDNDIVLPKEPQQFATRRQSVEAEVPLDAFYMAFHIPKRLASDYHAVDLLSDILGRGKSSRLYEELLRKKQIFNSINAYVSGSVDEGLLTIQGYLNKGKTLEKAEKMVWTVIEELKKQDLPSLELEKVKNKAESTLIFSEVELANRALNLAIFASLGNANLVNQESENLQAVSTKDIREATKNYLKPENASVLYYEALTS